MARQIQWVEAEELEKRYGIKGWEIKAKIDEKKLTAYGKDNLSKPLEPRQVLLDQDRVRAHNSEKERALFACLGDKKKPGQKLMTAFIPRYYHLSDCVFKTPKVKRCFPERINDKGSPKAAAKNQEELPKDETVKDALYYAGEMLLWAKNRPEGSKPITKKQFSDRFKAIRGVKELQGHDKGIIAAIWNMWAKYYPEIRTSTKGGRN